MHLHVHIKLTLLAVQVISIRITYSILQNCGELILQRECPSVEHMLTAWHLLFTRYCSDTFHIMNNLQQPDFLKREWTSNLSKAHKTHDSVSSSCSQVVQVYL